MTLRVGAGVSGQGFLFATKGKIKILPIERDGGGKIFKKTASAKK